MADENLIKTLFTGPSASMGENESEVASKVLKAFRVSSPADYWKIKAAVAYLPDERLGYENVFQTIGTTMYYLTGDCEDMARVAVRMSKVKKWPTGYVAIFADGWTRGHMFSWHIFEGSTFFIDYNIVYRIETEELDKAIAGIKKVFPFHNRFWYIRTDNAEKPIEIKEIEGSPDYGRIVYSKIFPDSRSAIKEELESLDIKVAGQFPVIPVLVMGIIGILWFIKGGK